MIELKDIFKSYYGQGIENKVLRHIDFKIEKGEFVMLYGDCLLYTSGVVLRLIKTPFTVQKGTG